MGRRLQNRHETAPILCAVFLDQKIRSKSRNRIISMRNQYKLQERGRDHPSTVYNKRGENMPRDTEEQEGAWNRRGPSGNHKKKLGWKSLTGLRNSSTNAYADKSSRQAGRSQS
ncbi:hypothetical protein JTB14_030582 [Gonioctena quinquepunctata]|nr:hypothetical protein JTB14_030582 [Gonioctena quinquepunctata]